MSSSQPPGDRDGGGQPSTNSFSLSSSSNGPPAKKTAFNLQSSRGRPANSPASKSRTLPRRPHQLGHSGDSSDEEESAPVHEEVSGFDTLTGAVITVDGKAIKDANEPLVIPVTSKNNWRDRAGVNLKKGKKNLLPQEVQALQKAQRNGQVPSGGAVETEGPSMAYGLSFADKPTDQEKIAAADEDQPMTDAKPAEETKPLTDDQIALQALISESKGDVERRSDLVIESSKPRDDDNEAPDRYDETSSFRTDVQSRPEPATLDQYNAIPVEEFGAALLRGMGWKDGQSIGRGNYGSSSADADRANKPRVPERRPGFLGIGAKDSTGGKGAEAEFGAWGKAAMRKASRKAGEENANGNTEGVYMPVMMRNKNTGEHVTEEELAEMKKASKSEPAKDDWRERRDRNLEKSGRDSDRDRDYRKRDYDDRSDRRSGSSRRDRSSSAGRHSSRRSRYDDDDDRRRDDRSYRDRDRGRERDKDRRRDRDDDKDSRRDRDRDRDRDRERRRDDKYSSSRHSSHSSRHDRDRDRDRDSRRSRRDD